MTIAVVTDSASDLAPELLERYDIHSLSFHVELDGELYQENKIDPSEIVSRMSEDPTPLSCVHPTPIEFEHVYRNLVTQHTEILSIHSNHHLFHTLRNAQIAAADPDFGKRVSVVHSGLMSVGLAMQVIRAAEMVKMGHSMPEILHELASVASAAENRFIVHSEESLQLGGHIQKPSLFQNIFSTKPIFQFRDGQIDTVQRFRKEQKVWESLFYFVDEFVQENGKSRIGYVASSDAYQDVEYLRELFADFELDDLGVFQARAVTTGFTGPGVVGFALEPVWK